MRHSLAVAGAVALAACSDALPTAPREAVPPPSALRGLNAEFTRMAQEIPGFGGMYYGSDGRLNVVVARGANPAAVTRAVANRSVPAGGLLLKRTASDDEMVVQQGVYDFAQLSRWYGQIHSVLGIDGVVFTDIDETTNHLRVGVLATASTDAVQQAVASSGVPAEAVSIETTEPIVAFKGNTLQDRVQPFGGGIQLLFPNPMPGYVSVCTLGFSIHLSSPGHNEEDFVTNSHCTLQRGVLDGTPYFQQPIAPLDPKEQIATEIIDLPFLTDPVSCPYAPFGYVCRYSDVAVANYEKARTPVRFGTIYHTASVGTGGAPGSIEFGPGRDFFSITDEAPFPMFGETLDKVGRTTGWTRGPVIGTCIDTGVSGTNIAMLCQDFVEAAIGGGDSGSPVFQQTSGINATLYGILWGGGGNLFVFSAMENIHFEFGNFVTH